MSHLNYSYRPAVLGPSPERLRLPKPECKTTPVFVLEGEASDVTTRSTRQKYREYRGDVEHVRVGSQQLNLTHEHDRGEPIALRLQPGARYRAEVYECLTKVSSPTNLPLDERTADGLVFYALAYAQKEYRDDADQRRICRGYIAIWTDGLSLHSSNTDPATSLTPGTAYKVILRQLPLNR